MGMPVPAADPNAVARMRREQLYAKAHHPSRIMKLPLAVIKSSPDVSTAAHSGLPNLNPPDDLISATEVLNQGAAGPSFSVVSSTVAASSGSGSGGGSNSVETETVTSSGDSAADPQPAANAVTTPSAGAGSDDGAPANGTSANSATSQTAATDASNSNTNATAAPSDPQSESTSKKKKGLHKIVPW
jgi:hypothetical protein